MRVPCVHDATTNEGLTELRRTVPDWQAALWTVVPTSVPPDITIRTWLCTGAGGDLLPRTPEDTAWIRRRRHAAGWLPWVPDIPLRDITDELLQEIVSRRLSESPPMSASTWRKASGLLRRWILAGQLRLRLTPKVRPTWDAVPTAGTLTDSRERVSIQSVHRLLSATDDPELRVLVGLAVGCRLLQSEALQLRHDDVDLEQGRLTVRAGARRGRPKEICGRVVQVPPWVLDLMWACWPGLRRGWCFPHRVDPTRPAPRADGRLNRLAQRIGEPGLTFTHLRRLGQAIARSAGGSRALVRGVVRTTHAAGIETVEERVFAREQSEIARAWTKMAELPHEPGAVPARAPKGCPPTKSELGEARRNAAARFRPRHKERTIPALPPSCRLPGPRRKVAPPLVTELARLRSELDDATARLEDEQWTRDSLEDRAAALEVALDQATIELQHLQRQHSSAAPGPDSSSDLLAPAVVLAVGIGALGVQAYERLRDAHRQADPTATTHPPRGTRAP